MERLRITFIYTNNFSKVLPTPSCCSMPKRLEKKNILGQKPRKLISNNRVTRRSMMESLASLGGVNMAQVIKRWTQALAQNLYFLGVAYCSYH